MAGASGLRGLEAADQPPKALSERSMARPRAAALLTVSSYSRAGTESATIPAPACRSLARQQDEPIDGSGGFRSVLQVFQQRLDFIVT